MQSDVFIIAGVSCCLELVRKVCWRTDTSGWPVAVSAAICRAHLGIELHFVHQMYLMQMSACQ